MKPNILFVICHDLAGLHGATAKVDEAIADLLNGLRKANLEKNILVVFTADHGIAFPRAKCTLYDPGIKTELFLSNLHE